MKFAFIASKEVAFLVDAMCRVIGRLSQRLLPMEEAPPSRSRRPGTRSMPSKSPACTSAAEHDVPEKIKQHLALAHRMPPCGSVSTPSATAARIPSPRTRTSPCRRSAAP